MTLPTGSYLGRRTCCSTEWWPQDVDFERAVQVVTVKKHTQAELLKVVPLGEMINDRKDPRRSWAAWESQRCQSEGQEKHMKETHKMGNKKPKDMRDGGEARSKIAPTDEPHFAGECACCGKSSGSARGRDAGRCEELILSEWTPKLTRRLEELGTLTQDLSHQWHVRHLRNRRRDQAQPHRNALCS